MVADIVTDCNKGGSEAEIVTYIELKTRGQRKTYAVETHLQLRRSLSHATLQRNKTSSDRLASALSRSGYSAARLHGKWSSQQSLAGCATCTQDYKLQTPRNCCWLQPAAIHMLATSASCFSRSLSDVERPCHAVCITDT